MRLVLLFARIAFVLARLNHEVLSGPAAARLQPLEHDAHLLSVIGDQGQQRTRSLLSPR
jgi:hypothetical protein